MAPLNGVVKVFDELDGPAGLFALAVAGDGDEVKGALDADGAGEIGEKNSRALEHTDQQYGFTSEIAVDLRTEFPNAIGDGIAADQNRWVDRRGIVSNRRGHTAIFSQTLVFFQ